MSCKQYNTVTLNHSDTYPLQTSKRPYHKIDPSNLANISISIMHDLDKVLYHEDVSVSLDRPGSIRHAPPLIENTAQKALKRSSVT